MINAHIEQMHSDFSIKYVADSALYVAEMLLDMQDFLWISRLTFAYDILQAVAPDLMSKPDQSAFCSLGTVYGDVMLNKQRWVVVYLFQAY